MEEEKDDRSARLNPAGNIAFFTPLARRLTANGEDISAISPSNNNNNNCDNSNGLKSAMVMMTTAAIRTAVGRLSCLGLTADSFEATRVSERSAGICFSSEVTNAPQVLEG